MKKRVSLIIVLVVFCIIFARILIFDKSDQNYFWVSFSTDRIELNDVVVSVSNNIPIESSFENVYVNIKNDSTFDISFTPATLSLQKKDIDGTWKQWEPIKEKERSSSKTSSTGQGNGLEPGFCDSFIVPLLELLPLELFSSGEYRVAFTYACHKSDLLHSKTEPPLLGISFSDSFMIESKN